MALRTPPSWLQNGSHPAENDRLSMQALWATTGIIGVNSLEVTENSPAGMSVLVDTGWAAIVGTTQANMGVYTVYNDASTALTVTTSDPTNPRIDRVVVTIQDAFYSGAFNDVIFQVIAGTPAGSPVAPATPANSISLATIAVGATVTQINTANITDTRSLVTTNIPEVGDISAVVAGTGLSGGGTSGSVTLNLTTPVAVANGGTGISSFGAGVATFLGTPSSANLAAALTDETGSGAAVFATSPTLTTPKITLIYSAKTDNYTFVSDDEGNIFSMNAATAKEFIIPTDATVNFAIGTQFNVFWLTGAGQPSIVAATPGTTTVISTGATPASPALRVANSMATALKIAADSWIVIGDIV